MNGFVVLNKQDGITSFKAAAALRGIYGEKKTGHTGTLDPMATGVLPVALGKATRFIDFLPSNEKGYRARLKFGTVTDTLDITGNVLAQNDAKVSEEEFLSVLDFFRGEISQLPPMYSAISKNGVRLYELARRGIEVEREERKVNIKKLEFTGLFGDEFEIDVICSKGTYIRSLIADIGEKTGAGAVMTRLCRTYANGFSLTQAKAVEEIRENPENAVIPIDVPFVSFPELTVTGAQAKRFSNGGELSSDRIKGAVGASLYRVYSPEREFLGLGEIKEDDMQSLWARRVIGT